MNTELSTKIADSEDYNIYLATEFINPKAINYVIPAPMTDDKISFIFTKEHALNMDEYKKFLDNSISRFRRSRTYKNYKAYLMNLGMNRCQLLGNITDDMADIEMHHNFLNIFDIAILISQHILNTVGGLTTFDLVELLKQEHRLNNIPIVMLSKTMHQMYHDNNDFYIPLSMTFGMWHELLMKYRYGITLDIAYKVIKYINNCIQNNELNDIQYIMLRDNIKDWGKYNDFNDNYNYFRTDNYNGFVSNSIPVMEADITDKREDTFNRTLS